MEDASLQTRFRIDLRVADGDIVVALAGELDIDAAPVLGDGFDTVIGSDDRDVVVDLALVEFIDSSGVAALIRAYQQLQAQGRRLQVINPGHQVETVLAITGLTQIFTGRDEAG
jgi:anti-anti-sigma factor